MATVLVTGCAGFIGSHLTDELLRRGDEVIGIDCLTDDYDPERKMDNLRAALDHRHFAFHELDLAEDPCEELVRSVSGVYHLAAQPGVRGSWDDAFTYYVRDNVLATQRVFAAAADAGVRVTYASSSSVYGNASSYPTSERAHPAPISPYAVTKLSCEHMARAYARSRGLDAVGLRYFTVYGPRQRPDMAVERIAQALLTHQPFELLGDGYQTRDLTFVTDAVQATIAAMRAGASDAVYNVGGGYEASLVEVIEVLSELSGKVLAVHKRPPAVGDVLRTSADVSRLTRTTGWRPRVTLEEGLAAHLAAVERSADGAPVSA
jgi:nucleoside-diphosphate-sugar epimerase